VPLGLAGPVPFAATRHFWWDAGKSKENPSEKKRKKKGGKGTEDFGIRAG